MQECIFYKINFVDKENRKYKTRWHCEAQSGNHSTLELGCCCWFTWMHFANYSILVRPGNTTAAVLFSFGACLATQTLWRCRDA